MTSALPTTPRALPTTPRGAPAGSVTYELEQKLQRRRQRQGEGAIFENDPRNSGADEISSDSKTGGYAASDVPRLSNLPGVTTDSQERTGQTTPRVPPVPLFCPRKSGENGGLNTDIFKTASLELEARLEARLRKIEGEDGILEQRTQRSMVKTVEAPEPVRLSTPRRSTRFSKADGNEEDSSPPQGKRWSWKAQQKQSAQPVENSLIQAKENEDDGSSESDSDDDGRAAQAELDYSDGFDLLNHLPREKALKVAGTISGSGQKVESLSNQNAVLQDVLGRVAAEVEAQTAPPKPVGDSAQVEELAELFAKHNALLDEGASIADGEGATAEDQEELKTEILGKLEDILSQVKHMRQQAETAQEEGLNEHPASEPSSTRDRGTSGEARHRNESSADEFDPMHQILWSDGVMDSAWESGHSRNEEDGFDEVLDTLGDYFGIDSAALSEGVSNRFSNLTASADTAAESIKQLSTKDLLQVFSRSWYAQGSQVKSTEPEEKGQDTFTGQDEGQGVAMQESKSEGVEAEPVPSTSSSWGAFFRQSKGADEAPTTQQPETKTFDEEPETKGEPVSAPAPAARASWWSDLSDKAASLGWGQTQPKETSAEEDLTKIASTSTDEATQAKESPSSADSHPSKEDQPPSLLAALKEEANKKSGEDEDEDSEDEGEEDNAKEMKKNNSPEDEEILY